MIGPVSLMTDRATGMASKVPADVGSEMLNRDLRSNPITTNPRDIASEEDLRQPSADDCQIMSRTLTRSTSLWAQNPVHRLWTLVTPPEMRVVKRALGPTDFSPTTNHSLHCRTEAAQRPRSDYRVPVMRLPARILDYGGAVHDLAVLSSSVPQLSPSPMPRYLTTDCSGSTGSSHHMLANRPSVRRGGDLF
ncbi:hypothetical protein PG988_006500 [Apiospora saccharicola]